MWFFGVMGLCLSALMITATVWAVVWGIYEIKRLIVAIKDGKRVR